MSDRWLHACEGVIPIPQRQAAEQDAAFGDFYQSTFRRIYAFLRPQLATPQAAQEVTGQVYLKAYRYWAKAPTGDAAVLWLFRIARTTLVDHWRREGRQASANVSIDELADLTSDGRTPEALCLQRERSAMLLTVVSELPEKDRLLLSLRFTGQRTNREIGEILGIREAAVAMRLLRALRSLKAELVRRGL